MAQSKKSSPDPRPAKKAGKNEEVKGKQTNTAGSDTAAENTKKHAGGAPTKYDPKYCQQIIDFFNRDLFERVVARRIPTKNGEIEVYGERPCEMPFFEDFADSIGVTAQTLYNWRDAHPDFFEAFTRAHEIQKRILVNNGLIGRYQGHFTSLVAKNMIGYRDKIEMDHKHKFEDDLVIRLQQGREQVGQPDDGV